MQHQKTFEEIKEILSKVTYKDWELRVIKKYDDVILCQWIFMAYDNNELNENRQRFDLELKTQACRKWFVSCYSTDSEVIRTAYLAVKAAESHETDENFLYDGVMLYDPHTDQKELAIYMSKARQDVREEMPALSTYQRQL